MYLFIFSVAVISLFILACGCSLKAVGWEEIIKIRYTFHHLHEELVLLCS